MAMFPPNPYDQLTNINRGMPQVAQPATTTQMQPSPPSLRNFMNQQHRFGPQHGHFGGGHFGHFPPKMMPGLMPKSAGTGLDMFSNNPEMARAAQQAAMMQYGQQPGLSPQGGQYPQSPAPTNPLTNLQTLFQTNKDGSRDVDAINRQILGMNPMQPEQVQQQYSVNQPMNTARSIGDPAIAGQGPMLQNTAMPAPTSFNQSQLNDLQKQYQSMGGTGAGFGQPTSVAMPAQNPYGQGQSSLSEAPQFGTGPTPGATFATQPNAAMPFGSGPNLASNNLMQQVGMK